MNEKDCQKLHKALEEVLNRIGPAFKHLIYEELEKSKISLDYPCSSLEDIEIALESAFGSDAARLLINALRKEL